MIKIIKNIGRNLSFNFGIANDAREYHVADGGKVLTSYWMFLRTFFKECSDDIFRPTIRKISKWRKRNADLLRTLKSDQLVEADDIVLHTTFNIIVDFIEIELVPQKLFFRKRDREYGIADLLEDSSYFGGHSNNIYQLYLWWTEDYLNRESPNEITDRLYDYKTQHELWAEHEECIRMFYRLEETMMLRRAIEIRDYIW